MLGASQEGAEEIAQELEEVISQFRIQLDTTLLVTAQTSPASYNSVHPEKLQTDSPITVSISKSKEEKEESEKIKHLEEEKRQEALRCRIADPLLAQIQKLELKWEEICSSLLSNDALTDRSFGYKTRALACEINAISSQASQEKIESLLCEPVRRLTNSISKIRDMHDDDNRSMPFSVWEENESASIPAPKWMELAARFLGMIEVEQAWEWWQRHSTLLPIDTSHQILNEIAAGQQLLFRALTHHHGFDKMQEEIYKGLKLEAEKEGYLTALDPHTSDRALEVEFKSLSRSVDAAKRSMEMNHKQAESEIQKTRAVHNLLTLLETDTELGLRPETLTEDRTRILPLLSDCKSAGVPPSNKEISVALMHRAHNLLSGQAKYSDFLRYASLQRKKHEEALQEEADKENQAEESIDPEMQQWVEALHNVTSGKTLIIAGGERQQYPACTRLQELLGFSEVKWLLCNPNTKASKYQNEIFKADIYMVALKLSSHELSEKGRHWVEEGGGRYLPITGGFSVTQIIRRLHETLVTNQEIIHENN